MSSCPDDFLADASLKYKPRAALRDWRNIENGVVIPTKYYADQPYIIRANDGNWVCVVTTGTAHEGSAGQHIVSLRSRDRGRSWSEPVPVEPMPGPEASYGVLLKAASGRIYCFYNHNTDNLRKVKADDPPYRGGYCERVDSLGYYVFRYSDDHGVTWSRERYRVPIRAFRIDLENPYGGEIRFFWNTGKPAVDNGRVYIPLHKVGGFGEGFFTRTEGCLLMSDNILEEEDPTKISWITLPEGDIGLCPPEGGGRIAEEQSVSVLSDGSLFCVYRSVDGHAIHAYSRDKGRTWTPPAYMRFGDGRLIKHPRAANFAWRCRNGNFLYWFHNHGGRDYKDRNPVWIAAGREVESSDGLRLVWSQPEVLLYHDDPAIRMSYPDLIEEDDGKFYITETQKAIARVHEIPEDFLKKLWRRDNGESGKESDLLLSWKRRDLRGAVSVEMPRIDDFVGLDESLPAHPSLDYRTSFTMEITYRLSDIQAGNVLVSSLNSAKQGIQIQVTRQHTLEITISDGQTRCAWDCDSGVLRSGREQTATIIVDGGPKVILFVMDGCLCDGGSARQFGWGRYSRALKHVNGSPLLEISAEVNEVRLYRRAHMVNEAVARQLHALKMH